MSDRKEILATIPKAYQEYAGRIRRLAQLFAGLDAAEQKKKSDAWQKKYGSSATNGAKADTSSPPRQRLFKADGIAMPERDEVSIANELESREES